ncbi:hypothetical protein AUK10_02320 [Candidatus Gracilibacteria bacterium CG2_30_37_12]|nr:MAG: hypothetical protein AUK10_02320 [Candidatus Gracilibacteria bacterium CG2_30_37_12]
MPYFLSSILIFMKKLLVIGLIFSSLILEGCFKEEVIPEIKKPIQEKIWSGSVENNSGIHLERAKVPQETKNTGELIPINKKGKEKNKSAESFENKEDKKGMINSTSDASYTKFVSPSVTYIKVDYTPKDLLQISNTKSLGISGDIFLRTESLSALQKLGDDFYEHFQKKLIVVSGYRSYEYQQGIEKRAPECVRDGFCARAGHSEHQSGLALDMFETTTMEEFLSKSQYKLYFDWLTQNAYKYGFTNSYRKGVEIDGYHEEPWHWRYIGVDVATKLWREDMTFTEYYNTSQK